jgi:hypothetical protein
VSVEQLEQEAERIRLAFRNAVASGQDGKALAQRWNEIQLELNNRYAAIRG